MINEFDKIVLKIIKSAGSEGIKGKELAKLLEQKDTRKIRKSIQNLRLKGIPICIGKGGGYFYTTKKEMIQNTISELLGRAEELMLVAERMSKSINEG